jgi:hypothetical protein
MFKSCRLRRSCRFSPLAVQALIRAIRVIRVHPPAVQAEKFLWYPCFLCEIIISRTGCIRAIRVIRVHQPSRTG